MIDPVQLLAYVIRPVLKDLDLWSPSAELLLLGTACAESECGRWLRQLNDGVALGIFQMEPATYQDCWINFLNYRPALARRVMDWTSVVFPDIPEPREMVWNLAYATAMCRIKYLRDPEPIPDTLPGMAAYYVRIYNTPLGKGSVEKYLANWQRFVAPDSIRV
jgi:hypothetical protein